MLSNISTIWAILTGVAALVVSIVYFYRSKAPVKSKKNAKKNALEDFLESIQKTGNLEFLSLLDLGTILLSSQNINVKSEALPYLLFTVLTSQQTFQNQKKYLEIL